MNDPIGINIYPDGAITTRNASIFYKTGRPPEEGMIQSWSDEIQVWKCVSVKENRWTQVTDLETIKKMQTAKLLLV